jgi:hypothetical protein
LAYGLIAWLFGASGFPLDDAWIHQTYARNLGLHGQWAFVLGQPSAGSTSPLWTLLLALGYFLRLDFAVYTLGLNAILLGGLAWLSAKLAGQWWVGVVVALEWHLAWAGASGMETVLFCGLVVAAWYLATKPDQMLGCGLVMSLAVWTRPDGLTLLPFVGLAVWSLSGDRLLRVKRLGWLAGGTALGLIPYFLFNWSLSGQLWPNTFFAKQAEYAILLQQPLAQRVAQIGFAPLVGVVAILLPGVFIGLRKQLWPIMWVVAYLLTYALRLPVTYQHARYLMPVLPVLVVVGGQGLSNWAQLGSVVTWRRVLSRTWVAGVGAVTVAFWGLGAQALVADNRVINSEMVATAKWVVANVPKGSLVAAHDIGALGYYADVRLLDLAGLVSPDVIPLLGDDSRLWEFVRAKQTQYVITYPGWCPAFTQDKLLTPVFMTGQLCSPADNLHMTVYVMGSQVAP